MVVGVALAAKVEDLEKPDGPWLLPDGWEWVPLKRLSSFIGRGRGPAYVASGGVPVVNQKCIRWHRLEPKHFKLTSRDAFDRLATELHIRAGDLLWNSTGTGTIGRAVVYDGSIPELTVDSHVTLVRPTSVEPSYLGYFIETLRVQHLVIDGHVGSTNQQELPRSFVEELLVPLPPSAEQGRIVARLDALFAEIADGEAALAEARKGLSTFRRALLKAAVAGKLTEVWRAANPVTETGHDLLARIAKDHAANAPAKGRGRRNSNTSPVDTAALPELPEGWAWAKVGDLLEFVTSGSRGWKEYYSDDGAIFVRAQNINSGVLDLSDVAFVRLPSDAEGLRTRLKVNDVLVTITGANVTVSARVTQDLQEAYVNQHVALLRPILPETSEWILLWLQAYGAGKSQLVEAAYGAGKPGLNLDNIREVSIAFPPPAEASEILRRVSHALSASADTLVMLDAEAADAARLKQSVLKAAFEGRLVPHDPADEPATALLTRLAANLSAVRARRGRARKSDV